MTSEDIDKCTRDKVAVLKDACDNAAKHYEDYSKGFTALDTKAQAIAAISGLVLAAVVAFLKDGRVPIVAQGNCCWVVLILAPRSLH